MPNWLGYWLKLTLGDHKSQGRKQGGFMMSSISGISCTFGGRRGPHIPVHSPTDFPANQIKIGHFLFGRFHVPHTGVHSSEKDSAKTMFEDISRTMALTIKKGRRTATKL